MKKLISNLVRRGCPVFLVAGWLFVFAPFAVYGQDAPCKQLEEKVRMLEKEIDALGDANAMLLENVSACTEENRELSKKLENAEKKPEPVKPK